jgi:hypothetical protein
MSGTKTLLKAFLVVLLGAVAALTTPREGHATCIACTSLQCGEIGLGQACLEQCGTQIVAQCLGTGSACGSMTALACGRF